MHRMTKTKFKRSLPALGLVLPLLGLMAPLCWGTDLAPPGIDILTWPRMSAPDFGCHIEQTLGYRDGTFNCASKTHQLKVYEKAHDPCEHAEAFHDGPSLPDALATRIHPLAEHVSIEWQGGKLQSVIVTLKGKYSEADVRKAFHLPAGDQGLPENIMQVEVGDANPLHDKPKTETEVRLTAFDFMDAMDFCGGGE
jgi:hypothetical protein